MKQKLTLLALVIGLTIVSQTSFSLGMSKIQVYTALDEPLRSSIELLTSADEELVDLEVKLASSEDYQKVGLDKSFVPSNILVELDKENPHLINVTSNGPVSEPIVSILLDVNWKNGRILREFTVLLDPPSYENANYQAQVNNVVVEPLQNDVIEEPIAEEPVLVESVSEVESEPVVEGSEQSITYTNEDFEQYEDNETEVANSVQTDYSSNASEVYVEAGDTLWRIANENKVADLSAQQMMMAIYNSNPSAFIDNNINKLIKGSRLNMPTADEAKSIGFSDALAQVESHHQSWTPEQASYNTYQTETDVAPAVEDSPSGLDYGVQLSGGDSEGSDTGQSNSDQGSADTAIALEEDLYNKDAENSELKERITELEDIVEQQQDVLDISDDGLANLESQLAAAADETTDEVQDVLAETGDAVEAVADDIWDAATDESDDLSLSVDVDTSEDGLDDESSDSLQAGDFDGGVDSDIDADNDNEQVAEDTTVADTESTSPAVFSGNTQHSESFVDTAINWVMDNLLWVLAGLVGLIVLIFLPKALRSDAGEDEDGTSFLDDIKNNKRQTEEVEDMDTAETKMNQPLVDDDQAEDEAEADSEGDVLAELDKRIDFDEPADEPTFEELSGEADELTELNETGAFETVEDDGFDLDGFLNDEPADLSDDNDMTATKDHAATLAGVDFADESEADEKGESEDVADDFFSVEDDADLEDLSLDDISMDDLDLDDAADTLETAAEETTQAVEITADDLDDEFSFDGEDDFDFDLDDELEELEQAEDGELKEVADQVIDNTEDAAEEFNDMLDISDEDTESFEIIDEADSTMDEEIDLGLEDLIDEGDVVETKIDLAKAYIEMGDAEGAKNLLNEIYTEGTEEQIAKAKKLLDDM